MKIHPRHVPVETARREIAAAITSASEKNNLTLAERMSILTEELAMMVREALRTER